MNVTNGAGALIRIEGMSSGYAGIPVVRGLNLHVDPGEVVALLGPNGAGKTTTLLTCSGIVKVLEGSATVLGEPVHFGAPAPDGSSRPRSCAGGPVVVLPAHRGREPASRPARRQGIAEAGL